MKLAVDQHGPVSYRPLTLKNKIPSLNDFDDMLHVNLLTLWLNHVNCHPDGSRKGDCSLFNCRSFSMQQQCCLDRLDIPLQMLNAGQLWIEQDLKAAQQSHSARRLHPG